MTSNKVVKAYTRHSPYTKKEKNLTVPRYKVIVQFLTSMIPFTLIINDRTTQHKKSMFMNTSIKESKKDGMLQSNI